jgi:hypothetical protein
MKAAPAGLIDGLLLALVIGLAGLVITNAAAGLRETNPSSVSPAERLRADPLDLAALRDLGLALDRQGRPDEADRVLSFVGRQTRRDGPTSVWLFRRRAAQGRFDSAFEQVDALLRRDAEGVTRPILFAVLTAAAAQVESRPALEDRLAARPWWRTDFLVSLGQTGDVAGAGEVLAALAHLGSSPSPGEYAPYVNRLLRAGQYEVALAAWSRIARRTGAPSAELRDGDFALAPDGTPFTWSEADGVGASSETEPPADGSGGRTLRVDYDGFSSARLPAQLVVLRAGSYRLSWRENLAPIDSSRVHWRLRCADSGAVLSAGDQPGAPAAPGPWRRRAMDFTVPASGCPAQWVELAADPGERRDPVIARFEAMRLDRNG